MAVTRLLNLKEGKRYPSSSLNNCIYYIFQDEKTEKGLWVGGNAGTRPGEVYETMMETKRIWGKEEGRQGYHFMVAFEPGEADEKTAFAVIDEWCREYLGENYDYVFAIHNDRAHMHGHIVFNSVSRTTGCKYRYENGDWEKYIQPVTDKICERHNLGRLTYEKKRVGRHYAEHMAEKNGKLSWTKIIRKDIDYAIEKSGNFEEVVKYLREKMDYKVRLGYSGKHGDYATFLAPGAVRGNRSYMLGLGYSVADIQKRVMEKKQIRESFFPPRLNKKHVGAIWTSGCTRYQARSIQRMYRACHYRALNPYRINQAQVRKDLLQINRLSEGCRYLLRHRIETPEALERRFQVLLEEEKQLKTARAAWSREERKISLEYRDLRKKLAGTGDNDDRFEEILDRMEKLEETYPETILMGRHDEISAQLDSIRTEKRTVSFLRRQENGLQLVTSQRLHTEQMNMRRR